MNLSHKSIVGNPKSKTAAEKRKIWQLKRKSVKRAFKAYTLRQKRKSKQVWNACMHRLDVGLYSHQWGNRDRNHASSKGKIPSTGGSEVVQTRDAVSHRTARPTHYQRQEHLTLIQNTYIITANCCNLSVSFRLSSLPFLKNSDCKLTNLWLFHMFDAEYSAPCTCPAPFHRRQNIIKIYQTNIMLSLKKTVSCHVKIISTTPPPLPLPCPPPLPTPTTPPPPNP